MAIILLYIPTAGSAERDYHVYGKNSTSINKFMKKFPSGYAYYGPISECPFAKLGDSRGWAVDCHNVWDDPTTQKAIIKSGAPIKLIISYVSFNGRLAEKALNEAINSGKPITLVYKHAHKALVVDAVIDCIGLIDDREANLKPVKELNKGYKTLKCDVFKGDVEKDETKSEFDQVSTEAELVGYLIGY